MEYLGLTDLLEAYKRLDIKAEKTFALSAKNKLAAPAPHQFKLDDNEDIDNERTIDNQPFFRIEYVYDWAALIIFLNF